MTTILFSPDVEDALTRQSPVALGVSGGKDSDAMALDTNAELDARGHVGPRVLIHSDLGRVEWRQSLPQCERLAAHLGLELVVVRRQAGDLMDRWLTRWHNNVARYANLECVKLILPWSTASMRFCTSELKTAIICRELVRRFPATTILSASGIRRDESTTRKHAPISSMQNKLTSKTHRTAGFDWHPIAAYTLADVRAAHERHTFPFHEAYTRYGNGRVSCVFCILGSRADLLASSTCPDNHAIYREMVDLEIASTFSFQDSGWLGDVAPQLLTELQQRGLNAAKRRGAAREQIERQIPPHLLYTAGWPTVMPNQREAQLLANVRNEVARVMDIVVGYTTADAIQARYQTLMAQHATPAGTVLVQESLAL